MESCKALILVPERIISTKIPAISKSARKPMQVTCAQEANEPLGAEAPPLVEGGGACKGGGVGIPRAHDRYIVKHIYTVLPRKF